MSPTDGNGPDKVLAYLDAVRLPQPPKDVVPTLDGDLPALPQYDSGVEQAVTVGSQIAEFASDFPAELRSQISNSFLLAQLAANRKLADSGGGTKAWYDRYVEVLSNTGWLVETGLETVREIEGRSLKVHAEIVPVLTAILGPVAIATPVVVTILNGLNDMDKDNPWITLFERESQRASANSFQISYASLDDDQKPRITLVCFELNASRSVTQVLFFKFSKSEATLRHFSTDLGINQAVFETIKDVIEDKIAEYVNHYVADIEI